MDEIPKRRPDGEKCIKIVSAPSGKINDVSLDVLDLDNKLLITR